MIDFEDTAIGRFLLIYAPIEYTFLIEYHKATKLIDKYRPISYQAIETIAYNSDNPAFKSVRFRKAMIDYRRFGLQHRKKVKWTISDAVYYAKNTYQVLELMKQCTG